MGPYEPFNFIKLSQSMLNRRQNVIKAKSHMTIYLLYIFSHFYHVKIYLAATVYKNHIILLIFNYVIFLIHYIYVNKWYILELHFYLTFQEIYNLYVLFYSKVN